VTAGEARRRLGALERRLSSLQRLWQESERLAAFDARHRLAEAPLAGVDEVGRGPIAGPIAAAAVVLPPGVFLPGLRDSKRLEPGQRELLARRITRAALAWSVAFVSPEVIDREGIVAANDRAVLAALAGLALRPDPILLDGPRRPASPLPIVPVVDGDALSQSVAAASVLAKVVRDRLMARLGEELYPGYGWERNMGYGTREHRQALAALGATPYHRASFLP
jgi:ribonuclease HII